jgi:cation transport regulator ChaB
MPYSTNSSLPQAVKDKIKSPKKRRQWRHVWNSEYSRHGDESRAFASAWAAVKKGEKGGNSTIKRAISAKSAGLSSGPLHYLSPWLWLP